MSTRVRPVEYLQGHAADVLRDLAEPVVITHNGEARAVLQDVAAFEQTQEALALLKLLALGQQDIDAGRTEPARAVIERLRSAGS
jgi:prevent-host-death family protein